MYKTYLNQIKCILFTIFPLSYFTNSTTVVLSKSPESVIFIVLAAVNFVAQFKAEVAKIQPANSELVIEVSQMKVQTADMQDTLKGCYLASNLDMPDHAAALN